MQEHSPVAMAICEMLVTIIFVVDQSASVGILILCIREGLEVFASPQDIRE
jgi:hypothetical protein